MRLSQLVVIGLACLAATGCRTDPVVALLERENFDLENQLYELADRLEDCRRENAGLQAQLNRPEGRPARPSRAAPSGAPSSGGSLHPERPPASRQSDVPSFPDGVRSPSVEVPDREMPAEDFLEKHLPQAPHDSSEKSPAPSGPNAPAFVPRSSDGAGRALQAHAGRRAENTQVSMITLNDRLTGGLNRDERIGHEGIITVIEPRDAEGRLVDAAAPVSVVVLDPALSGDAARVARWDFTTEEVARQYRRTPLSEGIHLEMVWPGDMPVHRRLHVFVRYSTDDGRRLEADRLIEVDVPTLEAQTAPSGPATEPTADRGERTGTWERRQSAAREAPQAEPPRTASVPAGPELHLPESRTAAVQPKGATSGTTEGGTAGLSSSGQDPAEQAPRATEAAPRRRRPEWSPHRP